MSLHKLEVELINLSDELKAENGRHKKTVDDYKKKIKEVERQKGMFLQGIDLEKINVAETVLNVFGLEENFDADRTNKAIRGLATNDGAIYVKYYGVKDYQGFIHQGCDCEYGYGPTHGQIVFSIGLRNPDHKLTEKETECCLYYLNIILDKKGRESIIGKGA
jgi:hypothetical protein